MKRTRSVQGSLLVAILLFGAWAPQRASAQTDPALETVLNKMDAMAADFHTTEASFVWEQYQKVVNDTAVVFLQHLGDSIREAERKP